VRYKLGKVIPAEIPIGVWIMNGEDGVLEQGWTQFSVNVAVGPDEEQSSRPRREAAIKSVAVTAAVVNDSEEESSASHLKSARSAQIAPQPGIEEAKRLLHILFKN
jgi:hypothetical protein